MTFLFRADDQNVGDWYSPPFRYFPFRPAPVHDLLDESVDLRGQKVVIVGGGGLGSPFFSRHLKRIASEQRDYKLIAWGVGVDEVSDPNRILKEEENHELYGDWFDHFDLVGTRVHTADQKYRYVPCASCLLPDFFPLRDLKPPKLLGFYNHRRVTLLPEDNERGLEVCSNEGTNLRQKLEFMANHEYIVTNTYHGVYWATLLNRKVICMPYKSGCFSFKYKPIYSSGKLSDDMLHSAVSYPDSLEESRKRNADFFSDLLNEGYIR